MIENLQANAVLLANQLNLSIFQQLWLVENNLLQKDEFGSETFFSPMAVSVRNEQFDFLVVPDRVQVTVTREIERSGPLFDRILCGIAKALPHTPYTALGFNFQSTFVAKTPEHFEATSRRLCLRDDNPLATDFTESNARFGLYLSKDVFDMRLRLDIKPARDENKREVLLVNFNFHRDLKSASDIFSFVPRWNETLECVQTLSNKLNAFIEE